MRYVTSLARSDLAFGIRFCPHLTSCVPSAWTPGYRQSHSSHLALDLGWCHDSEAVSIRFGFWCIALFGFSQHGISSVVSVSRIVYSVPMWANTGNVFASVIRRLQQRCLWCHSNGNDQQQFLRLCAGRICSDMCSSNGRSARDRNCHAASSGD